MEVEKKYFAFEVLCDHESSIVNDAIKRNSNFLRRNFKLEKNTKTPNKQFFPSYNVFVLKKNVAFVV